ncbi:uncharacterized protein BcabD6B2_08260 [Babesia caballi]|uniref:Uncharacterized protein n=1 Tax=Babesia caballi TaxID=5871 RepID=A0AAV4LQL2_BABCB|nr:hypothetical protein, conserved [Babesia caballi]
MNKSNGVIGVGGIAVSNDPRERLGDAVLGFIAEFLGQLKNVQNFNNHVTNINNAIKALNGGIGQGQHGFETAIQKTEEVLKQVKGTTIEKVFTQLKSVDSLKKNDLKQLSAAFQSYLQKVLGAVADDGSVKNVQSRSQMGTGGNFCDIVMRLMGHLTTLFPKFNNMGGRPIDLGNSGIQPVLDDLKNHNAHIQPSQLTTNKRPQSQSPRFSGLQRHN